MKIQTKQTKINSHGKIMLLDSQSLPSKFPEICNYVRKFGVIAACFTETRLTKDFSDFEIDIPEYNIIKLDSDSRHTGFVVNFIQCDVNVIKIERFNYEKNYWFLFVHIIFVW